MPLKLSVDAAGRVVEPEGKTREYKLNLNPKDRVLKAVVAFANSAGGELVVGVRDDGLVIGVADPLIEQDRLARMIADSIRPRLAPVIELVTVGGKTLVVADIDLGSQRPYYLKAVGRLGGTYYRTASNNLQAGPGQIADLERSTHGLSFDKLPCVDADISDLDLDGMSTLLGRTMDEKTLRSGNLARTEQGRTVPTNAGVLIGSPHPEQFLPHAWVQCARFRGPRKRDITDQADIKGPLPLAVDKVMEFLKRNAFLSAEFNGGPRRREDVWSIPLEPLKELVVNALVHSSYADHGTPIKIAFLDDEIRIESPGGLVPGMTIEQMKSGESSIRNPVLAAIFKELGFIETWGTGIPEVLQDLVDLGLPEPDFEEGHERLKITIHIQNHDPMRFRAKQDVTHEKQDVELWKQEVKQEVKQDVTHEKQDVKQDVTHEKQDVKQDVTHEKQDDEPVHEVLRNLGKYGPQILTAASGQPASRSEILAAIGLTDDYRAFVRHIVPLVESGLLERTIPGKPKAHTQRYVLTEIGQAVLATLRDRSAA